MPIPVNHRNHARSTGRFRTALAIGVVMLPAALATASNTHATEPSHATDARPNVVVMLADNLGYGDLGCYGSGGIVRGMPTPNIDGLAADGLMLTQFFVEPGCTPTRAALMTGRHSVRAGLGSIIVAGTPSSLQADEFTMAELFKKNGYATGMVGKWHLGQETQSLPINQGFDTYKVGILETTDGTMYPESMRRTGMDEEAILRTRPYIWESDGEGELRKVRPYELAYRDQVEGDIAGAAVEFIDDHASKKEPFFLYVGWSHVHYPAGAAETFQGRSPAGPYGDMLIEHDHRVGEILDAVDAAGIRENTVVVYLSDNGPVQFQASNDDFSGSSPGPFRGECGDVLEGSLRVPGMIRWPGRVPVRKSNEMVAIHDFLPTFASLLGDELPTERPIDGRDQLDFFKGEQEKSAREDLISFIDGEIAAVRWRNWRIYPKQIIESSGNPSALGVLSQRAEGTGYPALFNIARDPRERCNVVGTDAWVLGAYMKIVGRYLESQKAHPNPAPFSMTKFPTGVAK